EDLGVQFETAELSYVPKNTLQLGEEETLKVMGVINALEDLDDVQQVYSNLDISDEVMAKFEAAS
ncbi:MAG TPA: YebC/PmpR family DNA-binding transcriptional regulator, partial [Anaerolineales bacterium]|nr:YebC/PmpR family DNA-binding transcriptional regulator [Anaerolineales bacterium]